MSSPNIPDIAAYTFRRPPSPSGQTSLASWANVVPPYLSTELQNIQRAIPNGWAWGILSGEVGVRNVRYPYWNAARFGMGDGKTGDTVALRNLFTSLIAVGEGPVEIVIPPGSYTLGDVGTFSMHNSTGGGFGGTYLYEIVVRAYGAVLTHTGTGDMLTFHGQPSTDRCLTWLGGRLVGNASTKSLFKGRDCSRFSLQFEAVTDASTGRGILIQNWYSWSENVTIGYGPVMRIDGCKYGINHQGATAATVYEGTPAPGSSDSNARTRIANIFAATPSDLSVDGMIVFMQANLYNSVIRDIMGNIDNNGGSIVCADTGVTIRSTVIENILFEGANTSTNPVSTAVKFIGLGADRPIVRNPQWRGGYGLPCTGNLYEGGDPLTVTVATGVATTILNATRWSGNTTAMVTAKTSDNAIRGTAMVQRHQGTATLDIDTLTSTGLTFSQSAGNLQATQASGSSVTLMVTTIVYL